MTATVLKHMPLAAGSALVNGLARFGGFAFSQFMRAPLPITAVAAMAVFATMAGSNALYFQHGPHPAPMFGPARDMPIAQAVGNPEITLPAQGQVSRLGDIGAGADTRAVGAIAPASSQQGTSGQQGLDFGEPTGNFDVFAVQKKLFELKLFDGKVDGYYGPRTARAIRVFEERNGLTPMGAVTPEVIKAILGADAQGAVQASARIASVAPATVAPAPKPVVQPMPPALVVAAPAQPRSAATTIDSIVAAVSSRDLPDRPAVQPVPPLPLVTASAAATPAPVVVAATPKPVTAVVSREPVLVAPVEVASVSTEPAGPDAANRELVSQVQRGLASLGFLHGSVDGHPGEATARAIRNFEVYHNYRVSGKVSAELVDMLVAAGASI